MIGDLRRFGTRGLFGFLGLYRSLKTHFQKSMMHYTVFFSFYIILSKPISRKMFKKTGSKEYCPFFKIIRSFDINTHHSVLNYFHCFNTLLVKLRAIRVITFTVLCKNIGIDVSQHPQDVFIYL